MTFGKEFTTAVEQKQIAQQDAERAKFVVEKVSACATSWLRILDCHDQRTSLLTIASSLGRARTTSKRHPSRG
jgi:prohibitin 1